MRTLLTNADILLRKEEGGYETLRGAYLGINDSTIDHIGTVRPAAAYDCEKNMTGKLLAPGLINCHRGQARARRHRCGEPLCPP